MDCRLLGSNRDPLTFHNGYAARRISSNLKGSTKEVGWLQASTTKFSSGSKTCWPPATIQICNAPVETRESCVQRFFLYLPMGRTYL